MRTLDIGNPRMVVSRLDDDERITLHIADGNRGNPNQTYITESGLYCLILTSRKPEAKAFKRWVTHEVLPAIRKNGFYVTPVPGLCRDGLVRTVSALPEAETRVKIRFLEGFCDIKWYEIPIILVDTRTHWGRRWPALNQSRPGHPAGRNTPRSRSG